MVSVRSEELRQALAGRVARRVEGQGVPRSAVDAVVTRGLDALGTRVASGDHGATMRVADATCTALREVAGKRGWTLSFVTGEEGR